MNPAPEAGVSGSMKILGTLAQLPIPIIIIIIEFIVFPRSGKPPSVTNA